MFNPFRDEENRPLDFADITFADLAQLRDMDEGYVLEFKQAFTAGVKAKVPKIIASFANSSGGWLVIGIADEDHVVCPVPRLAADYSQIIGELCRRHVSPAPPFDVRFIPDPENDAQGVVVVKVDEGRFPPYVADGVVEIREGSTSGPATGAVLVELHDKATRCASQIDAFCNRTVFYPGAVPLFNLYLYHMEPTTREYPSRDTLNERSANMRSCFEALHMTCHVQYAHDSRIFRASIGFDGRPHSTIELFPDESMKLTVPAVLLDGEARARATEMLCNACAEQLCAEELPGELEIVSASDTMQRVTRMASLLDRYVRTRDLRWQSFAAAYELENMAGMVLWSDDPLYSAYVASNGPLWCATVDCRSRVRYLSDGEHASFRARQFAGSHFFEACGLPLGSPDPQDNALVDALLRPARSIRNTRRE